MIGKNNGTALIITMLYLILIAIMCATILGFSSGHYKLMTDRVNRFQSIYYAEGGMYLGMYGSSGQFYIESIGSPDYSASKTTVDLTSTPGSVESKNIYNAL